MRNGGGDPRRGAQRRMPPGGRPQAGGKQGGVPQAGGLVPRPGDPPPRHIASLRATLLLFAPLCYAKRRSVPQRGASLRKEALRGVAWSGPFSPARLGARPPLESPPPGVARLGARPLLTAPRLGSPPPTVRVCVPLYIRDLQM